MEHAIFEQYQNIINELSEKKIAIFCGAGISLDSGVPIVYKFYEEFLPFLFDNEDVEFINRIIKETDFPFERIIESVLSYTENDFSLLDFFKYGEPNTIHTIIAKMTNKSWVDEIYTTNFDLLIEKALQQEKVEYEKYYKEEHFSNISNPNKKQLFKVHGTIDNQDSIRTTLEKITQESLFKERKGIIQHLYASGNHDVVLIMGYSFSDRFDISNYIAEIDITKQVIVIDYTDKQDVTIQDIKDWEYEKNPFKNKLVNGVVIKVNTCQFMKDLFYNRFGIEIDIKKHDYNWEDTFNIWKSKHKDIKDYIAGAMSNELFFKYTLGKKYLETAYKEVNCLNKELLFSIKEQLILSGYKTSTNYDEFILLCKDSLSFLQINKSLFSPKFYNKIYGDFCFRLGGLFRERIDYSKSLYYYYKSYKYDSRLKHVRSQANSLNQLGNIYAKMNNPNMSIKCYNKSIKLRKECGYIGGVARSHYNIATYLVRLGKDYYKKAYQELKEAKILLPSGEITLGYYIDNLKGIILNSEGQWKEAQKILSNNKTDMFHEQSYPIYTGCLYDLGRAEIMIGMYPEAIVNLEYAFKISKGYNDTHRIFQYCKYLALAYLLHDDLDKSYELFLDGINNIQSSILNESGAYYFFFISLLFKHSGWINGYKELKSISEKLLYLDTTNDHSIWILPLDKKVQANSSSVIPIDKLKILYDSILSKYPKE
ncbi:MAG: SIR2 family protein [Alphaproteobacteria bacterium]|jgi:NAD-dependent SIR2 family protein deacetylase/tetratricopeptide (TPR) repeat protein|nr:SIR2 family protein [Alphaproteobacteria bacterium]